MRFFRFQQIQNVEIPLVTIADVVVAGFLRIKLYRASYGYKAMTPTSNLG